MVKLVGISFEIMCLLLFYTIAVTATLHDITDIVDLSDLDLANYMFFKNLPSQNPRTAAQANPFIEHFQKKKAVLDYFENLFFGNSPFAQANEIAFDPHFGHSRRPYFERKYGKRGERLIEMLGHGYSLEHLRYYDAIPKEFGNKFYPI